MSRKGEVLRWDIEEYYDIFAFKKTITGEYYNLGKGNTGGYTVFKIFGCVEMNFVYTYKNFLKISSK